MADYLTLLHECENFEVWKKAYDADAPRRTAAGLTQLLVLRDHGNPNLVGLMFQTTDLSRAKAMATSPELAATMAAAGVIGKPRVTFRHGEYTHVSAANYASMTVKVRDFDTALKAYAMDAAERKAASLTDLAVLQAKDDPSNILIVWTVDNIGRATAFFESPALAAHMVKNAGVIGQPERHFWKA